MELDKIKKIYQSLPSSADVGMHYDIKAFLESKKDISSYKIEKGVHQDIVLFIKMYDFNAGNSDEIFKDFYKFISYKAIDIIIREVKQQEVKYMFYTSTNDGLSAKMTVIFS